MGVLISYDDGNRMDDVMQAVITITPLDTPFMSSIKRRKASNTWHQWPRDSITTRQDNAVVEGASFSTPTHTAPTRSGNATQIFEKPVFVSSTEKWVKGAGISDMYDYQLMNATKAIATDVEHALLRGSIATGNTSVARRLAGVLNYISTNLTAVVSGTKLTESFFQGLLELAWIAGGDPSDAYCNSRIKRIISNYTAGSTKNVEAGAKKLTAAISVYESDFGVIKLNLCRDMVGTDNAAQLIVIDNKRWAMAVGEDIHDLPKDEVAQTGHSSKGVIRGELTLEALAEESNAAAKGLSTVFN